jgi:hypothetical protein
VAAAPGAPSAPSPAPGTSPARPPPEPPARSTCPAVDTPYPLRFPIPSQAELDARVAAFRAKNHQVFGAVVLEATGIVHILSTRDESLVDQAQGTKVTPRDRAAWLDFAAANPEVFNTAGCHLELSCWNESSCTITPAPDSGVHGDISFVKEAEDATSPRAGGSYLVVGGGFLRPPPIPPRRLSDDQARARLVGKRYEVYVAGKPGPISDPPNRGRDPDPCKDSSPLLNPHCPSTSQIELTADQLVVTEQIMCVLTKTDTSLRRVLMIAPGPDLSSPGREGRGKPQIRPLAGSPSLPAFTDAVTGEILDGTRPYLCQ